MRQSALIAALMAMSADVPASPHYPRRPMLGGFSGGQKDPRGSKAAQEAAIQKAQEKRARRAARNRKKENP